MASTQPSETIQGRLAALVQYDPDWHVLICTRCKRCFQTSVAVHFRDFHKDLSFARQDLIAYEAGFYQNNLHLITSPDRIQAIQPGPDTPPIKGLRLYRDGIACLLCRNGLGRYVCRSEEWMKQHLRTVHHYRSPIKKGGNMSGKAVAAVAARKAIMQGPVCCQTFLPAGRYARYFTVRPEAEASAGARSPSAARYKQEDQDQDQNYNQAKPTSDLRLHLEAELADIATEEAAEAANGDAAWATVLPPTALTALPRTAEQARWLQVTGWPRFLAGHPLDAAARLVDLPHRPTVQQQQRQRQRQNGLHQPPRPGASRGSIGSIGSTGGTGGIGYASDTTPDATTEDPILCHLLDAFDRNIGRVRESLATGELNIFDQHRLNSFIPRRPSPKPLYHQLQQGTYNKYQHVFQRLLCFVYRLAWVKPQSAPHLHHHLTDEQAVALANAVRTAQELAEAKEERGDREEEEEEVVGLWGASATSRERSPSGGSGGGGDGYLATLRKRADDACLILCISLLDHQLYGDVFDSLVVGFLAVLAIEEYADGAPLPRPRLSEAVRYTSHLSALIKVAQLLVAARALLAVERDEHDYPGPALEAMQERFMVEGTRSPVCWANKIRAYGKAIRDTTTSLGHIGWSDDGEVLSYKTTCFAMAQLRDLVAAQVAAAQANLAELLLVHADEDRADVVPTLSLRSLVDNPAESAPGWSFVRDPRNKALQHHDRWLLDRVVENDWLCKDFLSASGATIRWREGAVASYMAQVERFLERLLLLVHITGGQPARGTELLSIQYCNPADGQGRRNIFLENGLVSFVTYYHKGYSADGSTKIIHRYLPIEVSELLVYYVWLVEPFLQQVAKLTQRQGRGRGKGMLRVGPVPYLWGGIAPVQGLGSQGKGGPKGKRVASAAEPIQPWPPSRLSAGLRQAFRQGINTDVNIQIWRHAAIAISRRHLRQAKFKRDFIEAVSWAWNDEMAAHSTKVAGLTYARGMHEAPGHVAGAKAEYRRICREWHAWLGLSGYRSARKAR